MEFISIYTTLLMQGGRQMSLQIIIILAGIIGLIIVIAGAVIDVVEYKKNEKTEKPYKMNLIGFLFILIFQLADFMINKSYNAFSITFIVVIILNIHITLVNWNNFRKQNKEEYSQKEEEKCQD